MIVVINFNFYRWWAGVGWQEAVLPHERNAWSDETGAITLASKETYRLPTVHDYPDLDDYIREYSSKGFFEWVDDNWELDFEWSAVDREGWEYCNQVWTNPRESRGMGSFTRRRKWVRHMKLIQQASTAVEE